MTKASNPPEVAVIMRSTASDSTLKGVSTFALAAESTVIPSVVLGRAAATSVASIAPVPKEISGQRAPGAASRPSNKSIPPDTGMASMSSAAPCAAQTMRAIDAARVDAPTPPLAPTTAMRSAAASCGTAESAAKACKSCVDSAGRMKACSACDLKATS